MKEEKNAIAKKLLDTRGTHISWPCGDKGENPRGEAI